MLSFEALKQRKIFQWALAYLAGAWVLLQLVDLLSGIYSLPTVLLKILPILLAVGFVAVLILSWYHGEKGMQRVSSVELLMLAALFVIGGAAIAYFARGASADSHSTSHADTSGINHASVAVLPFANFSSDKEQEYFSDGITEEILNALAQINGLQVAARTSSFAFKDTNIPIDSIGARLRVAHVLEGSVRKAGERLRITAQLINAQSGYHVWSQQFDRDAHDVFAVQNEIALKVAMALQVALGGEAKSATSQQQISTAAHDEYLLGLSSWNKRTAADVMKALGHFQRATELQPDYAAAWAGVAITYGIAPVWVNSILGTDALPKARAAANKALALDPDRPDAHAALGLVAATLDYDWKEADRHFEKALELNPSYATAIQWHAESMFGRDPKRAIETARRAIDADPLSKVVRLQLAHGYIGTGQLDDALSVYERVIAMDSTWSSPYITAGAILAFKGDSSGARIISERMMRNTPEKSPDHLVLFRGMNDARYRDQALAIARRLENPVRRSYMLSLLRDRDGALAAFEECVRRRHTDENRLVTLPMNRWLREDPRFVRLAHTMHLEVPQ
ncbi:MAG TPA: hypothetical protein VM100_11435 [Longimicrobiales bacterium]|nr:hypothetical protein [Longimicrobiales bacterium]